MKKLEFESIVDYPLDKTWYMFSQVENYPAYLKYCIQAVLEGDFKEGAYWYDWTTVVYFPLKIRHKITKVSYHNELRYLIKNPFLTIEQTINFKDLQTRTKVNISFKIDFTNSLLEKVFGPVVYRRNTEVIEYLMNNYKKAKINETN